MEIKTVSPTLRDTDWRAPSTLPPATEIDAFTRTLFGHEASSPEQVAANELQAKSQKISHAIDSARATENALNNPVDMLAAQSTLLHAIVEVDLIAKTTGALAQGVNKLVSMQ